MRIIDFVDAGHPALLRMWERRRRGYEAMGYQILAAPVSDNLDFDMEPPNFSRSPLPKGILTDDERLKS